MRVQTNTAQAENEGATLRLSLVSGSVWLVMATAGSIVGRCFGGKACVRLTHVSIFHV